MQIIAFHLYLHFYTLSQLFFIFLHNLVCKWTALIIYKLWYHKLIETAYTLNNQCRTDFISNFKYEWSKQKRQQLWQHPATVPTGLHQTIHFFSEIVCMGILICNKNVGGRHLNNHYLSIVGSGIPGSAPRLNPENDNYLMKKKKNVFMYEHSYYKSENQHTFHWLNTWPHPMSYLNVSTLSFFVEFDLQYLHPQKQHFTGITFDESNKIRGNNLSPLPMHKMESTFPVFFFFFFSISVRAVALMQQILKKMTNIESRFWLTWATLDFCSCQSFVQ